MRGVGGDPTALLRMAHQAAPALRALDHDRGEAIEAVHQLRRGSDPARLHLDAGLLAEVGTLLSGWLAIDRLLLEVAAVLEDRDAAGALALALAGVRAQVAVAPRVTAADLRDELHMAGAASPAVVAAWFADCSPDEVALLARHGGAAVGQLDGAPLALRDQVNRRLVAAELDRLRREVAADGWFRRNLGLPGIADGWQDAHRADLARIRALEELQAADLVLAFDAHGDGRAVAAYGDPDAADHVATIVPGISNHLGNVDRTLRSARHLQATAADRRSGSVATIAWLGYDAPGSLGQRSHELVTEATHGGRATGAARDLARFVDGLGATRDGAPAHRTVIGHSYGSRVLGAALTAGTLDLDEAVAVGSPGMGVDSVGDWELPPGTRVWAESAGTPDPAWWLPGGGDDPVAHVPLHGRNPDDPAFGARGFAVDGASGHSAYFDHDPTTGGASVSLRSIAAIVVGERPGADGDAATHWAPGPSGGREGTVAA